MATLPSHELDAAVTAIAQGLNDTPKAVTVYAPCHLASQGCCMANASASPDELMLLGPGREVVRRELVRALAIAQHEPPTITTEAIKAAADRLAQEIDNTGGLDCDDVGEPEKDGSQEVDLYVNLIGSIAIEGAMRKLLESAGVTVIP